MDAGREGSMDGEDEDHFLQVLHDNHTYAYHTESAVHTFV